MLSWKVWVKGIVAAVLNAAAYLKQSPLPGGGVDQAGAKGE